MPTTKSAAAALEAAATETTDEELPTTQELPNRDAARNAAAAWRWSLSVRDFATDWSKAWKWLAATPASSRTTAIAVVVFAVGRLGTGFHARAVLCALATHATPALHCLACGALYKLDAECPRCGSLERDVRQLAYHSTLNRTLHQQTGVCRRKVRTILQELERHVPSYFVAPGELWPNGWTCDVGGRVFDLTDMLRTEPWWGKSMLGAWNATDAFGDHLQLTTVAHLVYALVLSRRYKDDPTKAWPGIDYCVNVTRACRRQVIYAMRELEAAKPCGFGARPLRRGQPKSTGENKGPAQKRARSRPRHALIRTHYIPPGKRYPTGHFAEWGGAVREVLPPAPKALPHGTGGTTHVHGGHGGKAPKALKFVFEMQNRKGGADELAGAAEVIAHYHARIPSLPIDDSWTRIVVARLRERGLDRGSHAGELLTPHMLCYVIDRKLEESWRQKAGLRAQTLPILLGGRDRVLPFLEHYKAPATPEALEQAAAKRRQELELAAAERAELEKFRAEVRGGAKHLTKLSTNRPAFDRPSSDDGRIVVRASSSSSKPKTLKR